MKTPLREIVSIARSIVNPRFVTFSERDGCLIMTTIVDGTPAVSSRLKALPDMTRDGYVEWFTRFNEQITAYRLENP